MNEQLKTRPDPAGRRDPPMPETALPGFAGSVRVRLPVFALVAVGTAEGSPNSSTISLLIAGRGPLRPACGHIGPQARQSLTLAQATGFFGGVKVKI